MNLVELYFNFILGIYLIKLFGISSNDNKIAALQIDDVIHLLPAKRKRHTNLKLYQESNAQAEVFLVYEKQKFHQLKSLFLPQVFAKVTVLTDFILI